MVAYRKIVGVDPSLTCSGWALFDANTGRLSAIGKIRGLPAAVALAERLRRLQSEVEALIRALSLGVGDILVCESPTTMRDPHAALKVEQVRGIFEVSARKVGIAVPGRVNPRSVHFEVMGLHGRQLARPLIKAAAVKSVKTLYQDDLRALGFPQDERELKRHQDIVDAILVGRLALTRVQSAQRVGEPLDQFFSPARERYVTAR